jgi:hypothetical protein
MHFALFSHFITVRDYIIWGNSTMTRISNINAFQPQQDLYDHERHVTITLPYD